MRKERHQRIAEHLFAVLQESDLPGVSTDERDFDVEITENYRKVDKHFDTSDGKSYYVGFRCLKTAYMPFLSQPEDRLYDICEVVFFPAGDRTRSKNVQEVLKGVLAKVRDMIQEVNPDYLKFHGTSASRDRLYHVMARRFFPGRFWVYGGTIYVALKDNPVG